MVSFLINFLLVCLRIQMTKDGKFVNYVEEKAVWEYMVCMLALFLATVCYVG
jgi:hypothetical protein